MKIKKTLTRLACALGFAAVCASASAQWAVHDPINWIQNFTSASAAIRNEINTAKTLIQQVNAAKDLARSTAGLKNLSGLTGADKASQLYSSLIELDTRLDRNLEDNGKVVHDLRAQFGASNMSWEQFATSRKRMETEQQRATRDHYVAVSRSMEETTRRRQEIVSQLSQVQGQTQAMQALGASLDVIIGQNQQIIATMVANQKQEEAKAAPNQSQQQWAENQRALYQKRVREAANQF